eukprot:UN12099
MLELNKHSVNTINTNIAIRSLKVYIVSHIVSAEGGGKCTRNEKKNEM